MLTETQERTDEPDESVIGREPQLALLWEFLTNDARAPALVLSGAPGIGKTTLWERGVGLASRHGFRVLSCRPSEAEAQLSFAALADLLEGVNAELGRLPAPQARALEVALLRTEPVGPPPEPRAIAAGFLNVLRELASDGPVLVAVDDIPWLDRSSGEVLCFAARRLRGHSVRFLLARRSGDSSPLEHAFEGPGPDRLAVGPLSLGGARSLLSQRLGLTVSRRVLHRIVETAQGNPLFMLELGRTVADRGLPEIGSELPLPPVVDDLFGARIATTSRPVRRLLLAIALAGDLVRSELAAIAATGAIDDAVDAGLLTVEGERVRAAHPLFAAAAAAGSTTRQRRKLHEELARVIGNEARRARHLALAAETPNVELAGTISVAAEHANTRGALEDAVELAEHALRLTKAGDPQRSERLFALARYLDRAGEVPRLRELLATMLAEVPAGSARARVLLLFADSADSAAESNDHLVRALAESEDDPALRAAVLARRALDLMHSVAEPIHEAEACVEEALRTIQRTECQVEPLVDYAAAWTRVLRGRPIDDLCDRPQTGQGPSALFESLDRVAALRSSFRGEVDASRQILRRLLVLADERGETWSHFVLRCQLCELELRAGNAEVAARLLDEWDVYSEEDVIPQQMRARYEALLAALRGVPDEAERCVVKAIAISEATGVRWDSLEALRARGIVALLAGEPERAVESLRAVWDRTEREGVDDPGVFPVAPDLVEALAELGEIEQARAVADRLRTLSEQQKHPWGLISATRSDVLADLASKGGAEVPPASMVEAVQAYEELGLRFDAGRSLLALGRWKRRSKKWGAARDALEQAARTFDALGCTGWAEEARSEVSRVAARRPRRTGELTQSEQRVVELAAAGRSNKEIARTLFVSVYTVEAHLKHAYAKLGVRSRAQLHGRLSAPS